MSVGHEFDNFNSGSARGQKPRAFYFGITPDVVSELILPLCKGELEGVDLNLNMIYPP